MIAALRRLLGLGLLAAAAVAAALAFRAELAREPARFDGAAPAAATTEPGTGLPELPERDPPPLERFSEAFERPLFSPTRRPPAPEEAAPDEADTAAPVPAAARLVATLHGVLLDGTERVALLTVPGTARAVILAEGETLSGWRLASIGPDSVVFERGAETVTLELPFEPDAGQR